MCTHLNDDNLCSGLFLELLDGLPALADDESDLVARDHHLEGGASGSGGSSAAGGVPWGTVAVAVQAIAMRLISRDRLSESLKSISQFLRV